MFNLAIDSKLRGCDIVRLMVEDIAPEGLAAQRAAVRQKKTGRPVRFELTEQTREAVDDYLRAAGKRSGEFLFAGRGGCGRCLTTRQYARLVSAWITSIGLNPNSYGTHSLRRTKPTRGAADVSVGKAAYYMGSEAGSGLQDAAPFYFVDAKWASSCRGSFDKPRADSVFSPSRCRMRNCGGFFPNLETGPTNH